MQCGGMCYRLEDVYDGCPDDGSQYPVPRSQQQIACLLALKKDSSLPVGTYYVNRNFSGPYPYFTSWYDRSVVAPAELVGTPGPGGDIDNYEFYVIIDRKSGKLVRTVKLPDSGFVMFCERPPLQ